MRAHSWGRSQMDPTPCVASRCAGLNCLPRCQRFGVDECPRDVGVGRLKPRVCKIGVANMVGSVAFGASAVASHVVLASGDLWNAERRQP